MTIADRQSYISTHISLMNKFERRFAPQIYKALKAQVQVFVDDMKSEGLQRAHSRLHTLITTEDLAQILRNLHISSGLYFGQRTYKYIIADARSTQYKSGFGYNEQWTADIINYFKQDLFSTVSGITDTTRQQILSILDQALQEGWGIDVIASKLESQDLLKWRAALIARTELVKGIFVGQQLAQRDQLWETEKEWVSAHDSRTRHSHVAADGQIVDGEEKFMVERPKGGIDMMIGPGDPTASIGNLANCRCARAIRPKRDDNGRLVKKQQQLVFNNAFS